MKIKFDCNLETWVTGIEIEADSYDNALAELYSMTFEQLVAEGIVKEFKINDVGSQTLEENIKVRVYDIEYSIEEDDYETPEEYNQVINSLPDTLVLDILVETDEDLEERVADEITHETNWLVKNFNYMIIEKK
jgi:hypothetical protein